MNNLKAFAVLHVALLAAVSTKAQNAFQQLTVDATMDIFRAGGYNDASNGVAPAQYVFRAHGGRVLAFASVTGSWNCLIGAQFYGPDGTNTCPSFSIAGPIGTFSGYAQTDFEGALVGMFLEDSLPETAPPTLRFYVTDSSLGGIPTDFPFLFPKLGEVFFIGDGRTGTGSGAFQLFAVPPTATHLYLGYVDSCDVGFPTPGCYSDNSGSMTAVFSLYDYDSAVDTAAGRLP